MEGFLKLSGCFLKLSFTFILASLSVQMLHCIPFIFVYNSPTDSPTGLGRLAPEIMVRQYVLNGQQL